MQTEIWLMRTCVAAIRESSKSEAKYLYHKARLRGMSDAFMLDANIQAFIKIDGTINLIDSLKGRGLFTWQEDNSVLVVIIE